MTNSEHKTLLSHYRQSIDNIDAALIHILAERFRCTERVGLLKAQYGLPARDADRERLQIERVRKIAVEAQLSADFAQDFLRLLLGEVVKNHASIAQNYSDGSREAAS